MLYTTIVTVALLGQINLLEAMMPTEEELRKPSPEQVETMRAANLEFSLIQEEWVYAVRKPRDFTQILTPHEADILRSLDCPHGLCRDLVSQEAEKIPESRRVRVLYWGLHSKSAETVHRCNNLLRRLFGCRSCYGSGSRQGVDSYDFLRYDPSYYNCYTCDGTGDARIRWDSDWVSGECVYKVIPNKHLFGIFKLSLTQPVFP